MQHTCYPCTIISWCRTVKRSNINREITERERETQTEWERRKESVRVHERDSGREIALMWGWWVGVGCPGMERCMMGTLHTPRAPVSDLGKQAPTRRHDCCTHVCGNTLTNYEQINWIARVRAARNPAVIWADMISFISNNSEINGGINGENMSFIIIHVEKSSVCVQKKLNYRYCSSCGDTFKDSLPHAKQGSCDQKQELATFWYHFYSAKVISGQRKCPLMLFCCWCIRAFIYFVHSGF